MSKMKIEEQILNILNSPMSISWQKSQLTHLVLSKIDDLTIYLEKKEPRYKTYIEDMDADINEYMGQL